MMSWPYFAFVFLTLLLTAFVGYGTYRTSQLLRVWTPDSNLLLLPGEQIVRAALLLACIGLGWLSGLSWDQLGWVAPEPGRLVQAGILWGLGLAAVIYLLTHLVIARTGHRFYSPVVIKAILPRTRQELWLVFVAMVPVVLVEELLFRSLLLGGLTPLLPAPLLLIGTALLFGAMHSPQGIWGMLGAAAGGFLLGWLFLQAGSLLLPAIAHYITNMAQIIVALRSRTTP
jgi:uncharacterized protein